MAITFPSQPLSKPKPARALPTIQAQPNRYRVCRDASHKPFRFWRSDVMDYVCDVENWSTAYNNNEEGGLWQYPEEMREPLREALEQYHQKKG